MSKLSRFCAALALIPILLGTAIAVLGVDRLEFLFGEDIGGEPTLRSAVRFLGAAFAALGGILLLSSRRPQSHAPLLLLGGAGLIGGVAARAISVAVDGWPTLLTRALAAAELISGLAFLALGMQGWATNRGKHG